MAMASLPPKAMAVVIAIRNATAIAALPATAAANPITVKNFARRTTDFGVNPTLSTMPMRLVTAIFHTAAIAVAARPTVAVATGELSEKIQRTSADPAAESVRSDAPTNNFALGSSFRLPANPSAVVRLCAAAYTRAEP